MIVEGGDSTTTELASSSALSFETLTVPEVLNLLIDQYPFIFSSGTTPQQKSPDNPRSLANTESNLTPLDASAEPYSETVSPLWSS